jgi:WXXGXW repeat (2 copies)
MMLLDGDAAEWGIGGRHTRCFAGSRWHPYTERRNMNHSIIVMPFFGLASLVLVAGCTVEDRTVVRGPRPPDRVEVITARPGPEYVWVGGRWERRGDEWEWISGRWERR